MKNKKLMALGNRYTHAVKKKKEFICSFIIMFFMVQRNRNKLAFKPSMEEAEAGEFL